MTDKDAIKQLELITINLTNEIGTAQSEYASKLLDAYNTAQEALKEREERQTGCWVCLDASLDPELEGCDLSYHGVGNAEQCHRIIIRSGAGKPMAIMFEEWSGKQWNAVGIYEPKFCPVCGRKLKEE